MRAAHVPSRRASLASAFLAGAFLASGVAVAPPAAASVDWDSRDLSGSQWYLDAIGAPQAWTVTRGQGVAVAVVDTGVDATHPDLAGRIASQGIVAYAPQMRSVPAGQILDVNGHGTAVAGIIAAASDGHGITGVAPEATILTVKVTNGLFTEEAITPRRVIADTITAAVAAGASVVNLSFGVAPPEGASTAEQACQAVQDLAGLDVVIIASAGNDGDRRNEPSYPAACPGVIAVGAVDSDGNPAAFSNYGHGIALAAPGVHVISTAPWHERRYQYSDGTSLAAPIVAGVAALVRSAYPGLSAAEVADVLQRTARDAYAPGRDVLTGAGIVDAAAAVGLAPAAGTAYDLGVRVRGSVVLWRPPRAVVTGYLAQAFNAGGFDPAASAQLGPDAVSWDAGSALGPDGWVEVTAALADGRSVRQAEAVRKKDTPIYWEEPGAAVTGMQATRTGKSCVRASWVNPPQTVVLRWSAWLDGRRSDGPVAMGSDSAIESDGALASSMSSCLPENDPASDIRIVFSAVSPGPVVRKTEKILPALVPVTWRHEDGYLVATMSPYWYGKAAGKSGAVRVKVAQSGRSAVIRAKAVEFTDNFSGHPSFYEVRVNARSGRTAQIMGIPQR